MMRLCHAAALALVGWYLMVPPVDKDNVLLNAPISQWVEDSVYDTADACGRAKASIQHCGYVLNGAFPSESVKQACGISWHNRNEYTDKKQANAVGVFARLYMSSQCIATDDPRLAK
jgi:hypothetical protein